MDCAPKLGSLERKLQRILQLTVTVLTYSLCSAKVGSWRWRRRQDLCRARQRYGLSARVSIHNVVKSDGLVDDHTLRAVGRMIEEVEELKAELRLDALADLEVLVHAKVDAGVAGTQASANASVADMTQLVAVHRKHIGVDELGGVHASGAAGLASHPVRSILRRGRSDPHARGITQALYAVQQG